jgi:hypothetical protein
MPALGLVKRKEIWLPTWRGWLLALVVAILLGIVAKNTAVPFLAPVQPRYEGVLVVEGWLPDYALEEAKRVFESHPYKLIILTGVPIDQGFHISKEKNYAQLATTTLKHLGMKEEVMVPVTCPKVPRDRTFSTARQVRAWLDSKSVANNVDVFTLGVHARRTWLLYRIALGKHYATGVIASSDRRYDADKWWKTSSGFRIVTSEILAYFYAKVLFRPQAAESMEPGSG